MQVVSVFNVSLPARVRLQTGLFIVVGATLALGSLAGCASSLESMAEHRGYEYQYALAERFRLGEGVEQDPAKARTGTIRPQPARASAPAASVTTALA
jgi:hypothetical protein